MMSWQPESYAQLRKIIGSCVGFLDERNNACLLPMRMSWQRGKDCGDTGDLEETVAGRL